MNQIQSETGINQVYQASFTELRITSHPMHFVVGGHGLLLTLPARVAGFLLEYNPRPHYQIRRSVN
jgi:hypothetical protein